MNYEKIGEFIAEKRKKKNLTQAELAKKLGVTDKAVSKWERGLGCPDISILEILAKELDVSVLELLKGRKIENEVIKVTEADDYVKDTFKVSKHLFNKESKKRVSIILMSISILIVIIMCIFNINTYRRLAKKEVVELSFIYEEDYLEEPYTSFNERKELLKKYANLVEHNKGSLTDEEQGYLLTFLNNLYEYYDKAFMFDSKNQSVYNVFVKGNAVCAGFAKASQLIFSQIGIKSYIVQGVSTGEHMWNIVEYKDKYYYFDSTASVSIDESYEEYHYWGLDQSYLNSYNAHHDDWYPTIQATNMFKIK